MSETLTAEQRELFDEVLAAIGGQPRTVSNVLQAIAPIIQRECSRLRQERDDARGKTRMCVNCGTCIPASLPRGTVLPQCVGPDGMSACTFDMTPQEAWEFWRQKYHDQRKELDEARRERDELQAWKTEATECPMILCPYEAENATLRNALATLRKETGR